MARTSTILLHEQPLAAGEPRTRALVALQDVPQAAWETLAANAIEPNAYYDPDWAKAACAHARGHAGAKALLAFDRDGRLIGLLPVTSARSALGLPLPLLVAWKAYAPLDIPLLDRNAADAAADQLIEAARSTGARALLIPYLSLEGPAAAAIQRALRQRGIAAQAMQVHARAELNTTQDAHGLLQAALGAKKLKELRRQRNRLADQGAVTFTVASTPEAVRPALETFLELEQKSWKGRRGTALSQQAGDAAFIRRAALALAEKGQFQIVTLACGGRAVASGLVLRQQDRAYFFKTAYEPEAAQNSPGVQLALDLTARLCADQRLTSADSTAIADDPMINHIWRGRFAVGDLFIPTAPDDPIAPLLFNTLAVRNTARQSARAMVHTLRRLRGR